MPTIKAVIFDVDGVILDSLASHLLICKDKNREYSLGLTIPSIGEFKEIVRSGTKISPMKFFFLSVGFPEHYANIATDYYNKFFIDHYMPKPFDGLIKAFENLKSSGIAMGLVTSNVKKNIIISLKDYLHYFPPDCILAKDDYYGDSKAKAILMVVKRLGVQAGETLYVGDQISDKIAAEEAGVQFAGVSYGWGFSGEETEFPIYNDLQTLTESILDENALLNPLT